MRKLLKSEKTWEILVRIYYLRLSNDHLDKFEYPWVYNFHGH